VEAVPNQHLNTAQVAPLLLADPNAENEATFDFWGVLSRRKWLVFLGLVTGMGLGYLYDVQTDKIYKSTAVVRIEPVDPMALMLSRTELMAPEPERFARRHDRIIDQPVTVERCLEANGLFVLSSFEDMSKEEVVQEVVENLEVTPEREDPFNYELTYTSTSGSDAQVVLNNLIETYRRDLELEYTNETDEFITLLRDIRNQFEKNYKQVQAEIEQLRAQITTPDLSDSGRNLHQIMIQKLTEEIQDLKNRLTSLNATRERILEAIEAGPEAMKEQVWILAQESELKLNLGSEEMLRQVMQMSNRVTQAQIAYESARLRLGPSHPTVKTLASQRAMWKKFADETTPAGGGAQQEADDVLLRRYLQAVGQDIADTTANLQRANEEFLAHAAEADRMNKIQLAINDKMRELGYIEDLLTTARNKIIEIDAL